MVSDVTYLPQMEAVIGCECDQSALSRDKQNPEESQLKSKAVKSNCIEKLFWVAMTKDKPEHSELLPLMLSKQFYSRGSKNPQSASLCPQSQQT